MQNVTTEILLSALPVLNGLNPEQLRKTTQLSHLINLASGESLFQEGDLCKDYIIISSGRLRVQKMAPDGHEIVLDFLEQGQQCNLTNTCLLGGTHYPADAIADIDSTCLLLPREQFHKILQDAPEFRHQIFENIQNGMQSLVNLLQEVAFGHMDQRLANTLLNHGEVQNPITITHQMLATELGTAREVISRLLKAFERNDWIALKRGKILLKNKTALSEFSEQDL